MRLEGMRRFEKSRFFPCILGFKPFYKNDFIIGLGGNVGDVKVKFDRLFMKMRRDRRFNIVESSEILINEAFGFRNQADFYNATILAQTSMSARNLLKIMANFERRFGRIRSFKNAPRTLDIDILYFSGGNKNDDKLTIPHPGASKRLSVILPLGTMKFAR